MDQARCSVQDCQGYTLRTMKLKASGEQAVERIIICVEIGSISCNKCDGIEGLKVWGNAQSGQLRNESGSSVRE